MNKSYSREELIEIGIRAGDISFHEWKENGLLSIYHISKNFGSWSKFREACGYSARKQISPKYTREGLIKLKKELGDIDYGEWITRKDMPSIDTIQIHFGSWSNFLRVCGSRLKRGFTKEDLIPLGKKVGNIGSVKWNKRKELPTASTIRNHFGTWNNFMRECGFEIRYKRRLMKEELLELGKRIGNIGAKIWYGRKDLPSGTAIKYHFGTWNNFMRECGNNVYNNRNIRSNIHYDYGYLKHWKNLIDEMESIIGVLGKFPDKKDLIKLDKGNVLYAIGNHHSGLSVVKERMGYGDTIPPELEQEFEANIEAEEEALAILAHFSDSERDAADLLRALNPEKFKSNIYRILSLGGYLGRFRASQGGIPANGIDDVIVSLEDLIDRSELVRNIIMRKAFQVYEQRYLRDKERTYEDLEEKLKTTEGNLRGIYRDIYRELKDLDSFEIPGIIDSLGE